MVPVYLRSVSFFYNNNNEKNAVIAARREKAPRSPSGRWRRFGSFLHGALQPFPVYVRGASFFFNNNKGKKGMAGAGYKYLARPHRVGYYYIS